MKIRFLVLSALIILSGNIYANPDLPVEGKTIFTTRCAACHNVNKIATGPALAGVDERRSIDWIINFVQSSQTMIKKGDKDAVALYEKFNRIPMPDHPDLTADDIKNVVAFIKSESKEAGAQKAAFKPTTRKPNYRPVSLTKDIWPLSAIFGAIILLIGSLLFAVKVNDMKKELVEVKKSS
ncbi:MAG: cytochrome c [Chitinophagaceae bacterium]|nr:cytochrome c [Chitinophagaceae bacterium]